MDMSDVLKVTMNVTGTDDEFDAHVYKLVLNTRTTED